MVTEDGDTLGGALAGLDAARLSRGQVTAVTPAETGRSGLLGPNLVLRNVANFSTARQIWGTPTVTVKGLAKL